MTVSRSDLAAMCMCMFVCLAHGTFPRAASAEETLPPELRMQVQKAIDRGLAYLRSAQGEDGGWTKQFGPAVTAIVADAFAADRNHGPDHPVVKRAIANILRYEQNDGGFYERPQNLHNYQTSVVLSFLGSLPGSEHQARIARAQKFLTTLQYDDGESIDRANAWYGGAGYNDKKRPDLSNTQMMLQALHDSGLSKDDPVYQRALVFVSRCQMNAATNDQPFSRQYSDGGFIYTAAEGGESKASEKLTEGQAMLQSYGSMTYAGFKSMIYCKVGRDDPRVRSAYEWIRRHYTLEKNPGMPGKQAQQGLYYYYHVFAKALDAWGEPVLIDIQEKPHNWRVELCRKVISLQRKDGSWINEADRWLEGDPNYVTGLTLQTLQTAMRE
ncbi:MAG: hypothetical protein DCC65_00685 [Planctomycetota bacterium]|nr:MAG: hypothetical protein DCC65_00685 [Planctomycetota bacterium]